MKKNLICLGLIAVATCISATTQGADNTPGADFGQDKILDPALTSVSKIVPDREVQDCLAKMVIKPTTPVGTDPMGEGIAELDRLRRAHSSHYFVRQLIYYLVRNKPGSDETFYASTVVPIVMGRLAVDRDPTSMLDAIAPFASADDKDSKFATEFILKRVEETDHNQRGEPSPYSEFLAFCNTSKSLPPRGIIIPMFMRKPSRALLTCENVYTDRHEREAILLAEHRMDDYLWTRDFDRKYGRKTDIPPAVLASLTELAKDKEWWPRLYVVAMLAQNPELREATLVTQLKADTDEMVKNAMAEFDSKVATSVPSSTPMRGRSNGEPIIRGSPPQGPGGVVLPPARRPPNQ